MRQAYLLNSLRADRGLNVPDLDDESILIFRKSKATNYNWEKQIMEQYPDKIKNAFEVSKQQCKVVLALSFYDLEELVEIHQRQEAVMFCLLLNRLMRRWRLILTDLLIGLDITACPNIMFTFLATSCRCS